MELTQEQVDKYNKEIAVFMGITASKPYLDWSWLMTAYVKLCNTLPHNFCDIQKNRVYSNGYIDLPFQQAVFYVVGKTCEEYNKSKKVE